MASLGRNYAWVVSYQLIVLAVPLITAPYIARVLGPVGVGKFSYVSSVGSIVCSFGLVGIYLYGNREIAYVRGVRERLSEVFWEIMAVRMVLAGACIGIFLSAGEASGHADLFLMYLPWVIANALDVTWVFVGTEDMRPVVMKNILAKLSGIIGVFVFVRGDSDVGAYLLAISLTTFVANMAVVVELRRLVTKPAFRRGWLLRHGRGSIRLFLPELMAIGYLQGGRVLLRWLTTDFQQVAYFDQAEKIVLIPLTLVTASTAVILPRLANRHALGEESEVHRYVRASSHFALVLSLPLAIALATVAPVAVPLYLGSAFESSVPLVRVMALGMVFVSFVSVLGAQYFSAIDRVGAQLGGATVASVVFLSIGIVLIPIHGALGAAVASVSSSLASFSYLFTVARRRVSPLVGSAVLLRCALAGGLMSLTMLTIGLTSLPAIGAAALQLAAGAVVYFCVLYLTRDSLAVGLVSRMFRLRRA